MRWGCSLENGQPSRYHGAGLVSCYRSRGRISSREYGMDIAVVKQGHTTQWSKCAGQRTLWTVMNPCAKYAKQTDLLQSLSFSTGLFCFLVLPVIYPKIFSGTERGLVAISDSMWCWLWCFASQRWRLSTGIRCHTRPSRTTNELIPELYTTEIHSEPSPVDSFHFIREYRDSSQHKTKPKKQEASQDRKHEQKLLGIMIDTEVVVYAHKPFYLVVSWSICTFHLVSH